jgi:uncharacterized RDD family membrane protein YckC
VLSDYWPRTKAIEALYWPVERLGPQRRSRQETNSGHSARNIIECHEGSRLLQMASCPAILYDGDMSDLKVDVGSSPAVCGAAAQPELFDSSGFWIRAGARLLDWVVLGGLGLVAGLMMIIMAAILESFGGRSAADFLASMERGTFIGRIGSAITTLAYHTCFEAVAGSTVGKRLLRLHVIDVSAKPITFGQPFKRSAGFFIDALFLVRSVRAKWARHRRSSESETSGRARVSCIGTGCRRNCVRRHGEFSRGSLPRHSPSQSSLLPLRCASTSGPWEHDLGVKLMRPGFGPPAEPAALSRA